MFAGTGVIGVAVSGGADSVALLHALQELYPGRVLAAAHLNHCLRGADADADEAFVCRLAGELGCEPFVRRVDVAAAAAATGCNLEQAGRRARYRFFEDLLDAGSCPSIATGHTRSDQAETVLFRLLRGACGAGLSAVRPVYRERIVRPMLDVSRAQVLEYLRASGLSWREDASNADPAFARNQLRHELLPSLRREWNPNVEAVLANTADWALEEERFWEGQVAALRSTCVRRTADGLVLAVEPVGALHPAAQRRLLDSVLKDSELAAGSSGFEHIEALRGLVLSQVGSGSVDLPGLRAERSFGLVLLRRREVKAPPAYDLPLPVPGQVPVPGDVDSSLRTQVVELRQPQILYNKAETALLDWDRVPRSLRLRNWRPGDRYRPAGHGSPRKIKDLFQRNRISAWRRAGWPVVVASGGEGTGCIVWAREFGPACEFAVHPNSRRALAVEEWTMIAPG